MSGEYTGYRAFAAEGALGPGDGLDPGCHYARPTPFRKAPNEQCYVPRLRMTQQRRVGPARCDAATCRGDVGAGGGPRGGRSS